MRFKAQQVRGHAATQPRIPILAACSGRRRLRIFDNQVEHASRENGIKFGLIILTVLNGGTRFRAWCCRVPRAADLRPARREPQDLNESLILAQNQRWRRA